MLTQERLKELLHYDPATGVWLWRKAASSFVSPGQAAGHVNEDGYRVIHVAGRGYRASHLAFLYIDGKLPDDEVDHRDCDPGNDAWLNLRPATSAQNKWNVRVSKNNRAGLKGAFWHKQMKKWRSQIMRHGVLYNLGVFDTPEEAHTAYAAAAQKHFGDYARVQ